MNIFYLSKDPEVAATLMHNKHVNKMILESAQMLSTAHRILDGRKGIVLKETNGSFRECSKYILPSRGEYDRMPHGDRCSLYWDTHPNHPSCAWVRDSSNNYHWLWLHMMAIGKEYQKRYGKEHATIRDLSEELLSPPSNIKNLGFIEPPQCMPSEYYDSDTVIAYTKYYQYKTKLFNLLEIDHDSFMKKRDLSDTIWIEARGIRYAKEQRKARHRAVASS